MLSLCKPSACILALQEGRRESLALVRASGPGGEAAPSPFSALFRLSSRIGIRKHRQQQQVQLHLLQTRHHTSLHTIHLPLNSIGLFLPYPSVRAWTPFAPVPFREHPAHTSASPTGWAQQRQRCVRALHAVACGTPGSVVPLAGRAPTAIGARFRSIHRLTRSPPLNARSTVQRLFGNKEMRILMLGLDAAGKTSECLRNPGLGARRS